MSSAAPRDASWYEHPDVTSFKVVHFDNGDEFALCNSGVPLGFPTFSPASSTPESARCKRSACAKAFAVDDESAPEPTDSTNGDDHD